MITRPRGALHIVAALVVVASGCERPRDTISTDTVDVLPPDDTTVAEPPQRETGWDSSAGPVLLLPGEQSDFAVVIFPARYVGELPPALESDSLRAVELFAARGRVGEATLEHPGEGTDCPYIELRGLRSTARIPAWSVGFARGAALPLVLDSVHNIPRADSARLVAAVVRVASGVDSEEPDPFSGLPFFVRDVRTFNPAPDVRALVAEVVRRITVEANPREERTLIVAERDSVATSPAAATPYRLAFSERSAGAEETVRAAEVIAAVRLGAERTPTIVLARDDGTAVTYSLLQRVAPRRWVLVWSFTPQAC